MTSSSIRALTLATAPLAALAVQLGATSAAHAAPSPPPSPVTSTASVDTATLSPALPAALGLRSLTMAQSTVTPYDGWVASGSGLSQGRTDVQLWIVNTTRGGWSTHEYQSGLSTSSFSCSGYFCRVGGRLSTKGSQRWVPAGGIFPAMWWANHPLTCGQTYQPVAYDPADGYVYGTPFATAACPIIH